MKKFLFAIIISLLSCPLFGQVTTGYHRLGQVTARATGGANLVVQPNAKVYVTNTATGTAATIYSDPLLSVPITGATVTADGNGNYSYYMPLSYCATERVSYLSGGSITTTNICSGSAIASIVLTTNGTSGASTLIGAILNIPVYPGYPSAGLAASTGSAWRAPLYTDVTSLWACSGFLKSDGTCANILAGVTSLNSLSGALSLVGDSSITVTPLGSNINLHATGAGGSGVQYNPTTTVYYFLSSSVMADDSRSTSTPVSAGAWSCNGTICDVNTTVAHNLTTSSWADLTGLTGWFTGNPQGGQQDTTFGSFKVASVISPTEFTVAYTRNTGSGTGGNVYDASYWPVYTTAQQPFFNGHGTVLYWWSPLSSAATNVSTFLDCTASPTYLVIQAGQNDVSSGQTASQIEGNLQTIWATAHTKGCKVVQEPMLPTNFGGGANNTEWSTIQQVNSWLRYQGPQFANKASGQYWDFPVDVTPYNQDGLNDESLLAGNGAAGSINFAAQVNAAFAAQGGKLSEAPIMFPWETGVGFSPANYFFLSTAAGTSPYSDAVIFDQVHDIWKYYQLYGTGGSTQPLFEYNWANAANGNHICNKWQVNTTLNNSFSLCLGYASSGSVNNYFSIAGGSGGTTDIIQAYADGRVVIPSVATSPSTAPVCPNGTNGALTTTGCATGGTVFCTPNAQVGTAYTLAIGDGTTGGNACIGTVTMTNAATNTVTVPPNSSVAFPVPDEIDFVQLGAGQTCVAAGAGVTLTTPTSLCARAQNSTIGIRQISANTWIVFGDTQ